jgi:hypothetical protein
LSHKGLPTILAYDTVATSVRCLFIGNSAGNVRSGQGCAVKAA